MFQFDTEDEDNNFNFSIFDRAKIEDLEINEKMEAENGTFQVVRTKNGYSIFCVRGKKRGVSLFPTLEKAFEFLESD